jgi:hypothetical protein
VRARRMPLQRLYERLGIQPVQFNTDCDSARPNMNDSLFDVLSKVTTATITTMLLKKGIRRCWMNGPKPLVAGGKRLIGPAFTLRFVPVR